MYFTFSFPLSKLYTISLLALLVSGLMLHHDPNHEESVSRSDGKTRKVQRPRVNFIASEHNRPTVSDHVLSVICLYFSLIFLMFALERQDFHQC